MTQVQDVRAAIVNAEEEHKTVFANKQNEKRVWQGHVYQHQRKIEALKVCFNFIHIH